MEPNVFDHQLMLVNLTDVVSLITDPPTLPFLAMIREILKLFQQMGGALAMAFADVSQKCDLINIGIKVMELNAKCPENSGLFTLMDAEIKLNVHILNGENWEIMGNGNLNFKNYESVSRTIVRINWFLNYVLIMLQNLYNDKKKLAGTCCSDAYSRAFGDKHKFHIRMAAKAAMLLAPSRSKILELFLGHKDENQAYIVIKSAIDNLEILCETLTQYLQMNKLENLP